MVDQALGLGEIPRGYSPGSLHSAHGLRPKTHLSEVWALQHGAAPQRSTGIPRRCAPRAIGPPVGILLQGWTFMWALSAFASLKRRLDPPGLRPLSNPSRLSFAAHFRFFLKRRASVRLPT